MEPDAVIETQIRQTKLGAKHEAQFIEKIREAGIAEGSATSRWLIASLLAVSGAGALAALNGIERAHTLPAAASFFVGLTAALGAGWFNHKFAYNELATINTVHGFWLRVEDEGVVDLQSQAALQPIMAAMQRRGRYGPTLGWISMVAFVFGAAFLGLAAKRVDISNDRRCLAIQRDMLSSQPRRSDGATLFQTLGCRPQGDGSVYAPASGEPSRARSR